MIEKRQLLPKIDERRLKTQEKNYSCRPNKPTIRRFTNHLNNSLSQNEYIKSWLQRGQETKKMRSILQQNHKKKYYNDTSTHSPSKQSSSMEKNTIVSRQKQPTCNQKTSTETESFAPIKSKAISNQIAPNQVEIFYKLEMMNRETTKEMIKNFSLILEQSNMFFKKMSPIIKETLIKIGTINIFTTNEYIYKESFPIRGLGIILWGAVYLKYKKSKIRFNCTAGNTIGEEVLFEKVDYDSKRYSSVENGVLCTNERCRAIQDSGILFISEKQYRYIFEDLIKWGFKEDILRCHNILHRNYFKKREFRGLMN